LSHAPFPSIGSSSLARPVQSVFPCIVRGFRLWHRQTTFFCLQLMLQTCTCFWLTCSIWLGSVGLHVSDTKCKILSISPHPTKPVPNVPQFTCQGLCILRSTSETYLGVRYASIAPFHSMFEDKVGKATAAYHECFDSEWRCVLKHLPKLYMGPCMNPK